MKKQSEIRNPKSTIQAKILVVDDDPSVCGFLEELLTDDGHQVVAVESGEAALAQIEIQEFDLALIDLKMKGIGGMEVLRALRQQSLDTAAIILTAHASLSTAVEALRRGAHDYLFKPCKTVEIRECVRSGLNKRKRELRQRDLLAQLHRLTSSLHEVFPDAVEQLTPPPPAPPEMDPESEQTRFLERSGLIVDFMRHVITLDGHLLELSPTEFDLLAYMISEAPRVVSPRELVREVQGYESEPWEARDVVRSHVYHIRQKIVSATGREDVIRTVRGAGYTIGE